MAGILAEAMQDSGVDTAPVPQEEPVTPALVSQPVPESVSAPVPVPVSVPAPVTVTVSPAATVSVSPAPMVSANVVKSEDKDVPTSPALVPAVTEAPVLEGSTGTPAVVEAIPAPVVPAGSVTRSVMPQPSVPTIQPDSVLWVSVSEDPSLNGRYMVNDASAIDFGYVGLVFLQDMRVEQAEAELKRVLEGRYLKNATVSVKLAKASYDRVGVQGTIEMPGDIKIGPGATIPLGEALRRAGGLRGNRENCRVKIVRGGLKTPFGPAAEGDVYSLMTQDGQLKVPDVFLRNDDLVYVFSPSVGTPVAGGGASTGAGGKRVVLLGEVPRRGVVEFAENEPCTLMYLLFKVGGLPRFAKASKITVVRRNKDGTEKKFLIDGEKLMDYGKPEDDLVLETGDRIVVPARKISFF